MLLLCLITWTGQFIGLGLDSDNMPAVSGGGFNQLGVLVSNTLLNYAFVVTVPSWVNEKKDGVSVNRTVVAAMIGATAMYIAIGVFGGLALNAAIQGGKLPHEPFFSRHFLTARALDRRLSLRPLQETMAQSCWRFSRRVPAFTYSPRP